jgi:SAM-dependent methyltransferase
VKSTNEMRRFWNARAREDAFYFVDTRLRYRAADRKRLWEDADQIVDYVLAELGVRPRQTDTVLEIGCGVGRFTRVLAGRVHEVIALDVSDQMLALARERCAGQGRVRWVLGDGVSLRPLPDASVDACISLVVFQHFPDPGIAFGYVRELGRVLRRGGWAALQVSNDPAVHRPRRRVTSTLRALAGRGPRGGGHRAWVGSHVELPALSDCAAGAGLELERVSGERSQYCQVLLRRR